jgi:signal transduction histidine kinase
VKSFATALRAMPLRIQLLLVFGLMSIATTVVMAMALIAVDGDRLHADLHVKAAQYTRQLQQQLQSVLEPDARLTARKLFNSLDGDPDVDGLAVYLSDGELIEGRGRRPSTLPQSDAGTRDEADHVILVDSIQLRGRPAARLYVSMTTHPIDAMHRRDVWFAVALAGSIVVVAFFAALEISKHISRRIEQVAGVADRVARGELNVAPLEEQAGDEIGRLTRSFNTMVGELKRLALERDHLLATERERVEILVREQTQDLETRRQMFQLIAESTSATPFKLDLMAGRFEYVGPALGEGAGVPLARWRQSDALEAIFPRAGSADFRRRLDDCPPGRFEWEGSITTVDDRKLEMRVIGRCEAAGGGRSMWGLMQDVTIERREDRERSAAQKLESVGRLAAGIAHEINTPLQYVSDNVRFLKSSAEEFAPLIIAYRNLQAAVDSGANGAVAAKVARIAAQSIDLDFILENSPAALADAQSGLERITAIVRSMKEFAHPDNGLKAHADLNRALRNTLLIARNEYKYVADVEERFDDMPPVRCHLGQINQVVLNLILNAAHAIGDVVAKGGGRGRIGLRTRIVGTEVEIAVSDTGAGVPESIRDKLFDPFFTTKAIGVGTGQGLAIARDVVVNKHSGTLFFESEPGKGTTFFVRLPIDAPARSDVAEERAA